MNRLLHIATALSLAVSTAMPAWSQPGGAPADKKYPREVTRKIHAYNQRLTTKTEKALARLSRWESKVRKILEKTSPEAAQRLFAGGQPTFGALLGQFRQGEAIAISYTRQYGQYMDELHTSLNYLDKERQEAGNEYKRALSELDSLGSAARQTEWLASYIAERKKLLLREALQYAGKSPVLKKMDKEAWYYAESIRNYKDIFESAGKRERLAKRVLNEIPAYRNFVRENSLLSSLFSIPPAGGSGGAGGATSLSGLQTRAGVQDMVQRRIASGGPGGMARVRQNLQEAQRRLSGIKDKLSKGGHIGSGGDVEMPGFRPDSQRPKTFLQRLQYGFDMQFANNNSLLPATSDMGLSIGYKLNDRSVMGVGASYRLGLGSIEHIRLTSEGVGLRSYLDWRIKGQWHAAGGYELNYQRRFKSIASLRGAAWQRSGLAGVSRQYKAGKKLKGEVKLLWDFLYRQHVPHSAPVVFRVGYKL